MLELLKLAEAIEAQLKLGQPDGALCRLQVAIAGSPPDAWVRVILWVGHDVTWTSAKGIPAREGESCVWSDLDARHGEGYLAWLREGHCGLPREYRALLEDAGAHRVARDVPSPFGKNHGTSLV